MKNDRLVWLGTLIACFLILSQTSSAKGQENPDAKAYQRGVALFAAEEYKEAVESFKQAVQLNPKNADALYHLGTSYRMIEQFPEAIESYKQALSFKPKWADALYGLGVTSIRQLSGNDPVLRSEIRQSHRKL